MIRTHTLATASSFPSSSFAAPRGQCQTSLLGSPQSERLRHWNFRDDLDIRHICGVSISAGRNSAGRKSVFYTDIVPALFGCTQYTIFPDIFGLTLFNYVFTFFVKKISRSKCHIPFCSVSRLGAAHVLFRTFAFGVTLSMGVGPYSSFKAGTVPMMVWSGPPIPDEVLHLCTICAKNGFIMVQLDNES